MMLQLLVILVLILLGAGAFYGFSRLLANMDRRVAELEREAEEGGPEELQAPDITEPLGPDGLVYLCAHRFVPAGAPRNLTNPRKKAFAPLTGEELEPRHVAEQMLHAVLVTLLDAEHIEMRVAEIEPSFMPPFPHKRWTLRAVRKSRLAGFPLAEALDCAFDLGEQRVAKRGGRVDEGIPLDELVEDMLKVMRQEMSFWEKAGVYADIRQYLEGALVDQGYLLRPRRTTWLERLRHATPVVNDEARRHLDEASSELEARLRAFRERHGSEAARETESVPGGRTEEVDPQLIEAGPPFEAMPLHDCLRIAIHEALMAIRQLEPSEDVGV